MMTSMILHGYHKMEKYRLLQTDKKEKEKIETNYIKNK